MEDNIDNLSFPGLEEALEAYVQDYVNSDQTKRTGVRITETTMHNAKSIVHLILIAALNYFKDTILGELAIDLSVYKLCRFINPIAVIEHYSQDSSLTKEWIAGLPLAIEEAFPMRLTGNEIKGILGEIARYRRECSQWASQALIQKGETKAEFDMRNSKQFWQSKKFILPNLSKLAELCFSIQPSSGAAERLFSMLKRSFTTEQLSQSLEDYTEGAIMLQYNSDLN